MSSTKPIPQAIPPELDAEMTPAVRAFVLTLLERIRELEAKFRRALRHAVIWRKLSFGTQSGAGSRFVETMLTVIETCQQRRSVFGYLTAAVQARLSGQPAPSLLSGV